MPNEVSPRELHQNTPAHGSDNITKLHYAHDQVVFANLSDELQQILTIYDNTEETMHPLWNGQFQNSSTTLPSFTTVRDLMQTCI